MPQNLSKTVTIIQFLPYIALNIGHGDLVSGMQLAVPNIMYLFTILAEPENKNDNTRKKYLQNGFKLLNF